MPPEPERLLNELIKTARNLGYLVASGKADSPQYREADERLQGLRRQLIELCKKAKT